MRITQLDDWEREQQLDRREEQEPSHLHREITPRPVRVFFFDHVGPPAAEKLWRPSDGGGK